VTPAQISRLPDFLQHGAGVKQHVHYGQIAEHRGMRNIAGVLAQLKA
jgi:hypothetical protein